MELSNEVNGYRGEDNPHRTLKNKGIIDSGCSRHMTGNKAYLADFQDFNGGPVAFGGSKGYITSKGKIKTGKLDFEDVSFVKELQPFNLFSVSQICDKKNKVLFTDTECLILSPDFKLPGENQVLLKVPRQNNMYSFNLENSVPLGGLACLIAKATTDESNSWHRRLGHVNFKNLNRLVKGNLDETSAILKDFIRQIENQLNQKVKIIRCDNGTEFKNKEVIEFCGLKGIKREYNNARTPQQNGVAERKHRTLIEAARTMLADSFLPNTFWAEAVSTACYVLNRVLVTKPHNKTPYELLTGKTPIISYIRPFGCHVTILNTIDHLGKFVGKSDEGFLVGYSLQSKAFRVYNLVTKRVEENLHINFLENKPNVAGKGPNWLFDLDYLTDSMNYHSVRSENQANLHAGQQETNQNTGTKDKIDAGDSEKEDESAQDCFELPIWHSYSSTNKSASKSDTKRGGPREEEQVFLDDLARLQRQEKEANEEAEALRKNLEQETENLVTQAGAAKSSSTNIFSTVSTTAKASGTNFVNTVSIPVSTASANERLSLSETTNSQEDDNEIPPLEDIHEDTTDGIFTHSSYDDEGAEADFTNLETVVNVSPIPTSRINPSHPSTLILGDPTSAVQTRSKVNKSSEAHAFVSYVQKQRSKQHKDFHTLFICLYFLSQHEPRRFSEALEDKVGSMIGSLMYVTASRPDIMFAVCACSRESSFDLESYSDSDYAGANLDRKSTTGGCQFLGRRLITWQCKKQTIVATSTTEAEYVAAASCCGQVLWIQNQIVRRFAQVVSALIKSKNSLVKHFEDMRLCRPSKENCWCGLTHQETCPIMFDNKRGCIPLERCVPVEVPKELPKVSMVNTSLKKLKRYLTDFDQVVKERTIAIAITEGTWGFEHTKACFRDEIILFIKELKDIFNNFNQYLVEELADVQKVFYQMEQAVKQHRLESRTFEVKMNQVLSENERLLAQAIDNDIVKTVVNLSVNASGETVNECQKCLELKTELLNKKDFVDKETYDKLCNELRAQSQAKDTVIVKLKEQIKSLKGNVEDSTVKMDMDEIETLNIELEHRVTKLVTENEHLKQTYKQLYDSIKPKRVQSKEQCDALIQQVNIKSGEISDLNAKLQEQGLVIAALKNELRKLKGKALDNEDTVTHSVDPKVSKDNMEPITPKLLNKRTAHSSYIKHTQEEALVLRDIGTWKLPGALLVCFPGSSDPGEVAILTDAAPYPGWSYLIAVKSLLICEYLLMCNIFEDWIRENVSERLSVVWRNEGENFV
ncbi:ribonuclease H-like domain-containing protein [Tanacetum coccineum]